MELLLVLFIMFIAFVGVAPKELTQISLVAAWVAIPAIGVLALIWQMIR